MNFREFNVITETSKYPIYARGLFNIRRLYPKPEYDVYQLNRNWTEDIRVAIRGQRKFQTPINWLVKIDVWSEATNSPPDQVITQQQSTGYLIGLI